MRQTIAASGDQAPAGSCKHSPSKVLISQRAWCILDGRAPSVSTARSRCTATAIGFKRSFDKVTAGRPKEAQRSTCRAGRRGVGALRHFAVVSRVYRRAFRRAGSGTGCPNASNARCARAGEGETLSVVVEVCVTGVGEARSEGVVHLLPATAGPEGKRSS
jgi:hypothetical protein